jgi:hypothetical protein
VVVFDYFHKPDDSVQYLSDLWVGAEVSGSMDLESDQIRAVNRLIPFIDREKLVSVSVAEQS